MVQDNGLGLSPAQQSKLFTMFKRMHTHVEGTGIGLYIVKRIIENNGGKIDVESEQGKGTVFKVYFKPIEEKVISS
jgi:signal transduction histidine kinase